MVINKNLADAARDVPIEGILQKAAEAFFRRLPEEPPNESILNLRSLVAACEAALDCIVKVDSKVRPQKEWLAALDQVETIRDETLEMIEVLRKLV